MNKRLKKLEQLLNIVEGSLTREEIFKAFEAMMTLVKEIKSSTDVAVQELREEKEKLEMGIGDLQEKLEREIKQEISDSTKGISELKKNLSKEVSTFFQKIGGDFKQIEDKLLAVDLIDDKIKKGEEKIINEVLTKIPEQQKELTPEEIRDRLENLKDEKRLDKDAIHGLSELIEELKEEIKSAKGRTTFWGGRNMQFISEEPTGTVDGANDTFYLATTPKENSLMLLWNGQGQRPTATTEYVLTGKKIKFNADSIPDNGSLWAYYTKL